jgi:integrase
MPRLKYKIPSYCHHKASGQAIVTLSGKDYYLGDYGSPESRSRYEELVQKWLAHGRRMPGAIEDPERPITVNELVVAFWEYAETYYRSPDGTPTTAIRNYRYALAPLVELFGDTEVIEFGPRSLKALQQDMIARGWCRYNINQQINKIRSVFKWGASEELVPGPLYQSLMAVSGLKKGRSNAKESEPVKSVPMSLIDPIKEHVSRQVWAMIQIQLHSGARPGEVVGLRPMDIDRTGEVWVCNLDRHKTAHHGHGRVLHFGPRAQKAIRPLLDGRRPDEPLFSPKDAEAERRANNHRKRKTPKSCGNRPGSNRKKSPKVTAREAYDVASYRRAISRGCDLAFPPPEHLQRIRVEGVKGQPIKRPAKRKSFQSFVITTFLTPSSARGLKRPIVAGR